MKSLFTQQFSNTNLLVGPLLKVKQAYYYLLFSLKSDMWTEIIRGHIFLNVFPYIDRVVIYFLVCHITKQTLETIFVLSHPHQSWTENIFSLFLHKNMEVYV